MATVYQEKPKEYEETAQKWTQMYAKEDKKTKDEELIESLSKEFDRKGCNEYMERKEVAGRIETLNKQHYPLF